MSARNQPAAASPRVNLKELRRSGSLRLESLVVLAVLVVVMSVTSPYFLSFANIFNVILATSTIGILALGATFVIGSAVVGYALIRLLRSSSDVPARVEEVKATVSKPVRAVAAKARSAVKPAVKAATKTVRNAKA